MAAQALAALASAATAPPDTAMTPAPAESSGPKDLESQSSLNNAFARLLVTHDRDMQELKDLNSVVFLVYGKAEKAECARVRKQWQDLKPESGPHPCGFPQRTLMWATLIKMLYEAYEAMPAPEADSVEDRAKKAIFSLTQLPMPDAADMIFRLKPKHKDALDDDKRPWAWTLMLARGAKEETVQQLVAALAFGKKPKSITLLPQKSQDGPLVKSLTKFLQKGGGGQRGAGIKRGRAAS